MSGSERTAETKQECADVYAAPHKTVEMHALEKVFRVRSGMRSECESTPSVADHMAKSKAGEQSGVRNRWMKAVQRAFDETLGK